jgi:predicted CDP-diglyceride synthetase/phosphatidate cytidylyltransferase
MKKDLQVRLLHTACLLLLLTPVLIALAAAFTLNNGLVWFYPLLFLFVVITLPGAWVRSRRPISRIYWAVMLSQFVLVFSTEVWLALKLAQYLMDK